MQVFISYARDNLTFAQRLADDLNNYDLKLWMDVRNIPHGANWDYEVQKGLDSSDLMLVLLSRASVQSQNVADEWSYFIEKDKTILPLLIETCDVPFRLSRRQRVDFRDDYSAAFDQLLRAIGSPNVIDPNRTARFAPPPVVSSVGSPPPPTGASERRSSAGPSQSVLRPSSGVLGGSQPGALPEIGVRMLPVVWADSYHWFSGMRKNGMTGDALINPRELAFVPRVRPILAIPYPSLIAVKSMRSIDSYLKITFYGVGGVFRSLVVMGAPAGRRKAINEELLNLLKLMTGRSLE